MLRPTRLRYYAERSPSHLGLRSDRHVPMRSKYGYWSAMRVCHNSHNCAHEGTVCFECVGTWSLTHEIRFENTVAGRFLLADALAEGARIESNTFLPDGTVERGRYADDGSVVLNSARGGSK